LIFKIIQDVLKSEGSLSKKLKELPAYIKYFNNLNQGIKSGSIYHQPKIQNTDVVEFLNKITDDDRNLIGDLFKNDVEEFLAKKNLKSFLDLKNGKDSLQIGLNTIFIEKPVRGLWTTGISSFYLPTKKETKNQVSVELNSIAPLLVTIWFNSQKVKTMNMPKLSDRKIVFEIFFCKKLFYIILE